MPAGTPLSVYGKTIISSSFLYAFRSRKRQRRQAAPGCGEAGCT